MSTEVHQADSEVQALGRGAKGLRGTVVSVGQNPAGSAGDADAFDDELERRLLEIGFVEGAQVEILHEGFWGRDPIAVKVDDTSVAIRRREANAILVRVSKASAADPQGGSRV